MRLGLKELNVVVEERGGFGAGSSQLSFLSKQEHKPMEQRSKTSALSFLIPPTIAVLSGLLCYFFITQIVEKLIVDSSC